MSEKIKTAVMEIIKAHMDGEDKNTKAVLSDVMKSVNELEILEQQPCDKAISCSDMLDAIGHGTTYTSEELQKIITNLPPVTQKSETVTEFADRCRECGKMRKGHWVYEERERLVRETDEGVEYETDYWCKCSKCGSDFGYIKMKDAFCKYCGAKMVEPQESEVRE